MPNLPSGTVTFLFTDIEGSTERWERDRAAMAAAVARHISLLEATIQAHGGVHFKTVGDAVQAAFPTAPGALAAALDGQRALRAEKWGEGGPLRVRMALHAGDAEPDGRGDYLALVLNRLARLLAAGHGGQVLLSQAVQQLTRDVTPDGSTLRDHGVHRLRDLLEPEWVFQLLHPDLPDTFPPLRTLESHPNNLPRQPTLFLGREREAGEAVTLLQRPEVQLLTLTGPPGVGKTRLALEATQRLTALVTTEVVFVDLAPIRNPNLVLPAIAAAVGVREAATSALTDSLQARLAAHPVVLLVDNFEHLLAAAPDVDALLQANAEVRLLVTSREPLRLRGEQALPVPPLGTPHLSAEMGVRDVVGHEAVALFVARARESDRNFRLSEENARAIAELCIRLDGLPLALELAAARVTHLSPAAIAERLAQRRPVLTAGRRDLPERQRTLADAIDWSYELLPQEEQCLFRRLSVFLGGCTLQAAEAVANAHGDFDLSHALAVLADKSLITRQLGREGRVRFTMLETIREYGLERLAASGEEAAVREAHATYFTVLAEDAQRDMEAATAHRTAIERLGDDEDNLRHALAWALEQIDPSPLVRLAQSLWRFWWARGHLSEGGRWLEHALERGRNATPAVRARTLIAAGRLAWVRGEFAAATRQLDEALALAPDPFDRCEALNALGDVAREQGDYERAEAVLGEAIVLGRAHEDWFHLGASLHNLGIVELERGNYDRAREALEEGLTWARRVDSQYLVYSALHYLSQLAFEQGDYARAAALRWEDLTLQRKLAPLNTHGAARFLEGVALLAIVQQQPVPAARLIGAAARLREEVEDSEGAERKKVAPWVDAAREKLGDEAFGRAWRAGRDLSLQTALDEAAALLATWTWAESPNGGAPRGIGSVGAAPTPPGISARDHEGPRGRQYPQPIN